MDKLDRLMGLKGAIAAGEYTPDGKLVSYKGNIQKEMAEMVAMMVAANTMMGKMQAEGFSKLSGMKWTPFHGWAVAAGDYAVCVMGNYGVFVELSKADFSEIFKTLMEVAQS
ncbi:DUF2173 family protein [Acidianus manzaensis]|uniref:Dynein regulation protein LC7 n=1 Tax=Acidianus manzaensis TaxID=282676 RepID=A0A1W6K2R6_9CREN|nr:DUF2173 family protein [Acidianus manzaensis]ARM76828.1 hypothetical protein B6F84_12900 [Acidianus manzaensis]